MLRVEQKQICVLIVYGRRKKERKNKVGDSSLAGDKAAFESEENALEGKVLKNLAQSLYGWVLKRKMLDGYCKKEILKSKTFFMTGRKKKEKSRFGNQMFSQAANREGPTRK